MGASQARPLAGHAQLLEEFSGPGVPAGEGFWQELLSFPVPLTKVSPLELEALALPYCEQLVQNNAKTHNFQTLLEHLLVKLRDVRSPQRAQAATDAVVFVRVFVKHLTETLNADDLVAFLDAPLRAARAAGGSADPPPMASWVERLCHATTGVLTTVPVSDTTYLLHLEALHLLLAMLSTQLYSPSAAPEPGGHPFTEVLMDSRPAAARLLAVLLGHVVAARPLPPRAPVWQPPPDAAGRGGVLRLVRSAAASVLWLPIQALTFLVRAGNQRLAASPLCETGLLALLALLHHAPAEGHANPFQAALRSLQDAGDAAPEAPAGPNPAPLPSAGSGERVPFRPLFESLGRALTSERGVLLLYDLLHSCPAFRNFLVLQKDLDVVLLPLLRLLYSSGSHAASAAYMLLIVLLILSQDPDFARTAHATQLRSVPWYSERLLTDTSLGSLMVVLLLRTAHHNLSRVKDIYLHTNTLAALANLAPHTSHLTSHAAQRLLSLLDMLGRRYRRLSGAGGTPGGGGDPEARAQELQVYFDFLRIVLEILNCVICRRLADNPELVYALLHRADVFAAFEGDAQFAELLENVRAVAARFNARIDAARQAGRFEWSVASVLQLITGELREWPPAGLQLRQFPELRFTYEEEAAPEGFFVPYVWTLVVSHTALPWRPAAIALFQPASPDPAAALAAELDATGQQARGPGSPPDAAGNV